MDSFWVFVLVVVIAGYVYNLLRLALKAELHKRQNGQPSGEVLKRLEKMEGRLANLETIVLEREKEREFEHRL